MKLNIYSIRDNLAEIFHRPFFETNNATAIRAFSDTADKQPHIEDYSLYLVGEWNDQNGQIVPCEPQRIFSGLDVKQVERELPAHLTEQAV